MDEEANDEQPASELVPSSSLVYCLKSLQTLFIVTIIGVALLCIIATALIGFGFFYTNITLNINTLRKVNFETITVNTESTLEKVSLLMNNLQGVMPRVNISDVEQVRDFTWQIYRRSSVDVPVVTSFYCGTAAGTTAGFVADANNKDIVYLQNYENLNELTIYNVTNSTTGEIGIEPLKVDTTFSAQRVFNSYWYRAAENTNTSRWSLSYSGQNFPNIMWVTLSTVLRSTVDNSMMYYCSIDVATKATGEFLRDTAAEVQGNVITVVEKQTGYMMACSDPNVAIFKITENGTTIRYSPKQASNTMVRESLGYVTTKYGANLSKMKFSSKAGKGIQLHYESFINNGRVILLNIGSVKNVNNLEWFFIQAIPKQSYFGVFYRSVYASIIITIVVVVLSILLATILGICVARPLRAISREMTLIANMNFHETENHRSWFRILSELDEMLDSLGQMKQGLKNFEKYVPAAVVQHVLRTNKQVQLGLKPTFATIMFLDIENFTTITESLQPSDLIEVMQVFFTHMSAVIADCSGVIDKYMGDCIMALFNAPTTVIDHECQAVSAALKMHESLESLNKNWVEKGFPKISIRVGINTATCLIGNVGSEQRVNYTALGDGVNIASRLEGLNKHFNSRTMIGSNTYEKVKDHFTCRWVSNVVLKGKSVAIHAYEVMCHTNDTTTEIRDLCQMHMELRDLLDGDQLEQAQCVCEEILHRFPTQECSSVAKLLERLIQPNFSKLTKLSDK